MTPLFLFLIVNLFINSSKCIPAKLGDLAGIWAHLDLIYRSQSIESRSDKVRFLRKKATEAAATVTPKGAAWLLARVVEGWNSARLTSAVASSLAPVIARDASLFVQMSKVIIDAYPTAPSDTLIENFLYGREEIVDSKDWVQYYLTKMQKSEIEYCNRGESRDCGVFQRNLAWIILSFPETIWDMSEWLMLWGDRLEERKEGNYQLKVAYIRCYLGAILITEPRDPKAITDDIVQQLRKFYSSLEISDRLEAIEYYLWYYQVGDNLERSDRDIRKSLAWIVQIIAVPDRQYCNAVIDRLIRMEAYRTLSLIWQLKLCPSRVLRDDTLRLLEGKSPLCFAVYLTHGTAVRRHVLDRRNLSDLNRLLMTVVPRKKGNTFAPWNPCRDDEKKLIRYEWEAPKNIESFPAPVAMLLIRFLLYIQFGIPFDHSRTDSYVGPEEIELYELPGAGTTLIDRYCQLGHQYPVYAIVITSMGRRTNDETIDDPETSYRRTPSTDIDGYELDSSERPRDPPNSLESIDLPSSDSETYNAAPSSEDDYYGDLDTSATYTESTTFYKAFIGKKPKDGAKMNIGGLIKKLQAEQSKKVKVSTNDVIKTENQSEVVFDNSQQIAS